MNSRLRSIETMRPTQADNNASGLATLNRELIARAEALAPPRRLPTESHLRGSSLWRHAGKITPPRSPGPLGGSLSARDCDDERGRCKEEHM